MTEQTRPVMDGADDADDDAKRAGLQAQVDIDHPAGGDDAEPAKDDDYRRRAREIGIDPVG